MKPDLTYIDTQNLSYGRIEELELIPGFQYQSGPDFRWFESGPLAHASLQGENWCDWSIVKLATEAVEAATALGLPVVMVSWESPWHPRKAQPAAQGAKEVRFDFSRYEPLARGPILDAFMENAAAQGFEPVEVEPNVWVMYVEPATFIGLVTTRHAIFELARYFVLASREEYRNPVYDYGGLPPGNGWGEYEMTVWGRSDVWWLEPREQLEPDRAQILREDFIPTAKELKAPDSGSYITGDTPFDRDVEWIGPFPPQNPQTVAARTVGARRPKFGTRRGRRVGAPAPCFEYQTCCVAAEGPDITDMVDAAHDVSYQEFVRNCEGVAEWARDMGYEATSRQGLTLKKDWYVSYHRSVFRGLPCYYLVHSAIEYIWTLREDGWCGSPIDWARRVDYFDLPFYTGDAVAPATAQREYLTVPEFFRRFAPAAADLDTVDRFALMRWALEGPDAVVVSLAPDGSVLKMIEDGQIAWCRENDVMVPVLSGPADPWTDPWADTVGVAPYTQFRSGIEAPRPGRRQIQSLPYGPWASSWRHGEIPSEYDPEKWFGEHRRAREYVPSADHLRMLWEFISQFSPRQQVGLVSSAFWLSLPVVQQLLSMEHLRDFSRPTLLSSLPAHARVGRESIVIGARRLGASEPSASVFGYLGEAALVRLSAAQQRMPTASMWTIPVTRAESFLLLYLGVLHLFDEYVVGRISDPAAIDEAVLLVMGYGERLEMDSPEDLPGFHGVLLALREVGYGLRLIAGPDTGLLLPASWMLHVPQSKQAAGFFVRAIELLEQAWTSNWRGYRGHFFETERARIDARYQFLYDWVRYAMSRFAFIPPV